MADLPTAITVYVPRSTGMAVASTMPAIAHAAAALCAKRGNCGILVGRMRLWPP
jgi:hypothetical protein